jgi:hypothetical protein
MLPSEKQNMNAGRRQIGYFCHLRTGEKHLGGILITNQIGVPVEFKYIEPVVATRLHKILYGQVLERYLHETVIRDRLVREIRSAPDYFVIPYEDKDFLGTLAGKEMMAVQRVNGAPVEAGGTFTRLRESEAMLRIEDGPMLRLAFSTPDSTLQQNMVTWLQEIGRTMDILEPIDRVFTALKSLCGEEKRD